MGWVWLHEINFPLVEASNESLSLSIVAEEDLLSVQECFQGWLNRPKISDEDCDIA